MSIINDAKSIIGLDKIPAIKKLMETNNLHLADAFYLYKEIKAKHHYMFTDSVFSFLDSEKIPFMVDYADGNQRISLRKIAIEKLNVDVREVFLNFEAHGYKVYSPYDIVVGMKEVKK